MWMYEVDCHLVILILIQKEKVDKDNFQKKAGQLFDHFIKILKKNNYDNYINNNNHERKMTAKWSKLAVYSIRP